MRDYRGLTDIAISTLLEAREEYDMRMDEVSILFNQTELLDYTAWAIGEGYDHFNSVVDKALRLDDVGIMEMHFEFIRLPEAGGRIEAMAIMSGQAPLHQRPSGTIIHVSFKCDDLEDYEANLDLMQDYPFRAEYRNSYGRFAYHGMSAPFIKPRVNLSGR